jgi:metal-responsive CopG/Arc/MetJ family transcriptional regulator
MSLKMKMPVEQHRKATGMRLPKPLFAALETYSRVNRYRRTEIIEMAIQQFLERQGAYPASAEQANTSQPVPSPTASASP